MDCAKDTISVGGGIVSEDGVVESFDNDDEALDAFDNGVVVIFSFLSLKFLTSLHYDSCSDQNLIYRSWTSRILAEYEV